MLSEGTIKNHVSTILNKQQTENRTHAVDIARQRLQEKVMEGLLGPLTLVTAPACFGKTILIAACVEKRDENEQGAPLPGR